MNGKRAETAEEDRRTVLAYLGGPTRLKPLRVSGSAAIAGTLLFLLSGCSSHDEYFPLALGSHWTYTVKEDKFATRVQELKVTRRVPVAAELGYEVEGPMGQIRLGWRDGILYANELPNTRVFRPIPLLDTRNPTASHQWSGQVESMGIALPATAKLTQKSEPVDIGAKRVDTLRADLAVYLPNNKVIELDSWYAKGIGLVKQDQRTNGNLDIHLEWLGEP